MSSCPGERGEMMLGVVLEKVSVKWASNVGVGGGGGVLGEKV